METKCIPQKTKVNYVDVSITCCLSSFENIYNLTGNKQALAQTEH